MDSAEKRGEEMNRLVTILLVCFGLLSTGCSETPIEPPHNRAIQELWDTTTEADRVAIANHYIKEKTDYADIKILSVEKWWNRHAYMKITVQLNYRPQFKYKDTVIHRQNPNEFYPNFKYRVVGKRSWEQDTVGNEHSPLKYLAPTGTILVVVEEAFDIYELVRIGNGPEHTKTIEVIGNLLKRAE